MKFCTVFWVFRVVAEVVRQPRHADEEGLGIWSLRVAMIGCLPVEM